ncbi:MAG: ATP-binding cassette domain-containing protein [Bacteroidota bacterium]
MMDTNYIIETKEVSFSYGHQAVLRGINLQVPHNTIFGFLGPNGVGKSTTIKMLLGLIHDAQDRISIFGKSLLKHRIAILRQVGALIDEPTFYDHLSARENLTVLATLVGVGHHRIDETLQLVGLDADNRKKVKTYSVGMKQRLGLAIALLSDPPLLILDEPANGLDPHGIIELRKLLSTLQKEQGKTIFVSSHILDEVEKIATHIAIIYQGQIRFQGSKEELTRQAGSLEEAYLMMTTEPV